jgi:UPF0176 protein
MTLFHVAFYRFTPVADPPALRDTMVDLTAGMTGTVLVAPEGLNAMLAGSADRLEEFQRALTDQALLDGAFAGTAFKRTACAVAPFRHPTVKVKVRRELVPLGVDAYDMTGRVSDAASTAVSPQAWRELIARDDVVVIDNRNSFEFRVGHFTGAVDPGTVDFADFADFIRANAETWKANDTTVAMYCTGGVRCDKASPWMQDLGLRVAQLDGGILNYLAALPDAERDWEGACFVFDDRGALDSHLQQADVSGIQHLWRPTSRHGVGRSAARER